MTDINRIKKLAGLNEASMFTNEPSEYTKLVEKYAMEMNDTVWEIASKFVADARAKGLRPSEIDVDHSILMADESDPIQRLIAILEEAGFHAK